MVHRRHDHPSQPRRRRGAPDVPPPADLGRRKEARLREPSDHGLGRSRGGFGTKIHLASDSRGNVVGIHITAGQAHESRAFEPTMARRLFHCRHGRRRWPRWLAGDKGYSYPRIRRWCRRRKVKPVIPTRSNQPREEDFDKVMYKRRNIIERVVGWYKECRRLCTRYEKLAVNYIAMWLVAIAERTVSRLECRLSFCGRPGLKAMFASL